jgi:hypothetical protein
MFTQGFGKYTSDGAYIETTHGAFVLRATLYRDDCGDRPDERDDAFYPSRDPEAAGYVLPENFDAEMDKAKRAMAAWERDEWFYVGVAVAVECEGVPLVDPYAFALWGVECNYPYSDNDYLREVANELAPEAIEAAKAKLAKLAKVAAE